MTDAAPARELSTNFASRLPLPKQAETFGIKPESWKVLTEAIFPSAKSPEAVVLALAYCKSRNLDIFKRPVHIVPIWDSKRQQEVETIWPGIGELRTTAARTHGYAGKDEAVFGPTKKQTFSDKKGDVTVEFPEWAQVTVYRIVQGVRCAFVGPKVRWLETYATYGGSDTPNSMWQTRSFGQLDKCAEAAALRTAFPEEIGNEYAAEEVGGTRGAERIKDAEQVAVPVKDMPTRKPAPPPAAKPEAKDAEIVGKAPLTWRGQVESVSSIKPEGGKGQPRNIVKGVGGIQFYTFHRTGPVIAQECKGTGEEVVIEYSEGKQYGNEMTKLTRASEVDQPPQEEGLVE
jgi:phage recombination protein Bet